MSKNEFDERSTLQKRTTPPQSNKPSSTQPPNTAISPQAIASNIYRVARDPVLFFCRKVIFAPPVFKLFVLLAIVLIGSLLKSSDLPRKYQSEKSTSFFNFDVTSSKNVINVFFVKLGWGWTMGLLIPFVYLTLITTETHYRIITSHLVRLVVATGIWYFITNVFVHVEDYTGRCTHEEMRGASRRVCISGGHKWEEGIELSGHTFLLLYALLVISEEVKSYHNGVKSIKQASKTTNASGDTSPKLDPETLRICSKVIQGLYIALAVLTVLWELMLLTTALYFHYTLHKIFAAIFAAACWYITYYVWYRRESTSILYPSSPKE